MSKDISMKRKLIYTAGFVVLALSLVWLSVGMARAAEPGGTGGEGTFFQLNAEKDKRSGQDGTQAPAMPPTAEPVPMTPELAAKRWQEASERMGITPPAAVPAASPAGVRPVPAPFPVAAPVPVKPAAAPSLKGTPEANTKPAPAKPAPARPEPLPVGEKSPMPKSGDNLPPEVENYKQIVNDQKKQFIQPNKVQFARLSRNYINHISCAGKIEKLMAPQDQALEAEIANDNHDLFLRVGPNPNAQFPVDLTIVCDGQVFLLNAVVRPEEPSKQLVLKLPAGTRPLSEPALRQYSEAISKSSALPVEEKVSKIVKRIYQGDHLPYWQEIETPTSATKWSRDGYSVLLQKVVRTNIDGIVSWDFIFRGSYHNKGTYDVIRKIVKGEIIAFGRVDYAGLGAARVIVLTREDPKLASASGGSKP